MGIAMVYIITILQSCDLICHLHSIQSSVQQAGQACLEFVLTFNLIHLGMSCYAHMSTASGSGTLLGPLLHGIMHVPLVSHLAISANSLVTC